MATTPLTSTQGAAAAPDSEPGDGFSELAFINPHGSKGLDTLRQNAQRAVQSLVAMSLQPAVLLVKEWHVLGVPFEFEHMAMYHEIASAVQSSLVSIARPEAGGLEHLLFAVRVEGLRDEEYLACVDDATARAPRALAL